MGNLYRFVEPVLLFLIKRKERAYGYELSSDLAEYALTDAAIEIGALYRTLRQLEKNGCVKSEWDTAQAGPARRQYMLTNAGEKHLEEWISVLEHLAESMTKFIGTARAVRKNEKRPRNSTRKLLQPQ
jgi:poly-beta-hydroxybutyrate-responsive repressor